jgi:hypothetical protein
MLNRIVMAAVLTVLLAAGATSGARPQQPTGPGFQATTPSGWSFDLTPHLRSARINMNLNFNLPPALGAVITSLKGL